MAGTVRTVAGLAGYLIWWIMMEDRVTPRICRTGEGSLGGRFDWLRQEVPRLSLPARSEPSCDDKTERDEEPASFSGLRQPYRQNGQSEDHADDDVHNQQGVVQDDGEAGLQQEVM